MRILLGDILFFKCRTSHAFDTDTSMMWWFLKSGATVWLSKLVFPHVFTQRLLWLDDEQCVHGKGDQNQGQQDTISKSGLKHRQKDRAAFSDFFWQNGWRGWSVFGIPASFWFWSVVSVSRSSWSLGEVLWTRFQPEMGRRGEHFETEGSHTRTGRSTPGYAWMKLDCRLCMWSIPSLDLALTTSRVWPPPSSAPASCFSVSGQGGRCRTWSTRSAPPPCSASPSPSPGSSLPTWPGWLLLSGRWLAWCPGTIMMGSLTLWLPRWSAVYTAFIPFSWKNNTPWSFFNNKKQRGWEWILRALAQSVICCEASFHKSKIYHSFNLPYF